MAQVLRDGKGAACTSAVAEIATYMQQTGGRPPCGDTGNYCRARAKLSLPALRQLTVQTAERLEQQADPSWLSRGLHAKLIDGFTFTMADTPANQQAFPQQSNQRPGAGFPIAWACAVLSLATAAICDLAVGPYQGKETGESALLRQMLDSLNEGDLAVFDRHFCSFPLLALLGNRGVHFAARLHQRRPIDFRRGKRLGKDDHLLTWTRPTRPQWMSEELYATIPPTLTLREVRLHLTAPGRRTQTVVVVTSLTDPAAWPREAIAELYGFRWNVETTYLEFKQTLGATVMRSKTIGNVTKELTAHVLAYQLVHRLMLEAGAKHHKKPHEISFLNAARWVEQFSQQMAVAPAWKLPILFERLLDCIATTEVDIRPGRLEPRAISREKHRYPWRTTSHQKWRAKQLAKVT